MTRVYRDSTRLCDAPARMERTVRTRVSHAAELANAVVISGTDHVAGFAPDPTARRRTSGNDLAPFADFADLLLVHAG